MIRYLENNEKQNIRPLYQQCFDDSREYTDYYFEKRLPDNIVAVYENNGIIMGALHLIPQNVVVDKFKTNIMYIYGVGTLEKYRNQGIMKDLFFKVLKDMFSDTEPFTYLIPSDETNAEIYRKLGFEYVMDRQEMKPAEQRKKPTHSLISRRAEHSDLMRMVIFAQSAMEKKYSIALAKDMEYFRKIKELIDAEGGYIEIYVENKVIVGYRIWIDDEIIEEVLDSSIQTMSWLDGKKKPYAMARILNVRTTLRMLGVKDFGKKVIKISDPVIEENNGCFKLMYQHGNVKLNKVAEESLDNGPDFEITIGELTAHVFGYKLIEGLPAVCSKDGFFINDYV